MRFIFNCICFLFRFIWRLVWGLIWSAVLSFVVIVGVFYFTTSTDSGPAGLSQAVQAAVVRVEQLFNG